ncbi:hypothetical protein VUR80DRAFT_2845 [Thermomyces stellatus]
MVAPRHLLLALLQAAWAWDAPSRDGYRIVWQDNFAGDGGSEPSSQNWHVATDISVNNELQRYTTSNRNIQKSGGETLQIIPWREGNGWTSGRVESKYTFTPQDGSVTAAEAQIRFGDNSKESKQGYWPAFWLLGDAVHHGTEWPACGEIDIFESVNGKLEGSGTVHCDVDKGGVCNEPQGRGASVTIPSQGWNTWRVEWDLRDGDWRKQSLSWYLNGERFHMITGGELNENAWASLAHSKLFFILNMAIGGNLVSFWSILFQSSERAANTSHDSSQEIRTRLLRMGMAA